MTSLTEKYGGIAPNKHMLWHGTSKTDPKLICQSEEGFDMRYANAGMWGHGNYFAVNASYSNNGYAFKTVNG